MMGGLIGGLFRFAFGLALGAAAGAALAMLLTPASGEDLRRQLRQRIDDALSAGERAERDTVASLERSFREKIEQR
jgi:gas vesicle protein